MKWLILTDQNYAYDSLSQLLIQADKRNKLLLSDFSREGLKNVQKNFFDIAACLIYTENKDSKLIPLISGFAGLLLSREITIVTNLEYLSDLTLFSKTNIKFVSGFEEAINYVKGDYWNIHKQAVTRLSKKHLLDRGIPFTSDCMATYIAKNKLKIVNEFLEAGMGVNVRDDFGTPMLNIACRNDSFDFVQLLLDLGAELNAVSEDRGYTAVMDAVWRGNEKITKYLIEKGAELNTINKEGQTNLILAVGADRLNLCKLLVENGADPDVKDMMGMSAYTYANLFRKEKIVEVLKPYHKEF